MLQNRCQYVLVQNKGTSLQTTQIYIYDDYNLLDYMATTQDKHVLVHYLIIIIVLYGCHGPILCMPCVFQHRAIPTTTQRYKVGGPKFTMR